MTQEELTAIRGRAIAAAQAALPWDNLFLHREGQEVYHVFKTRPKWTKDYQNDPASWVVKMTNRDAVILCCSECRAMDYIGRCAICDCTNSEIYQKVT